MIVPCALIFVFLIVFILYLCEIPSLHTYRLIQKIPGPKSLPIFGIAIELFKLNYEDIFPYFNKIIQDYPRVRKAWLLGMPIVILSEPEDIKIIMNSTTHIQKGFGYQFFGPWLSEGLLTSDGDKWKARRKILTPSFHFKILDNTLGPLNEQSRLLLKNFLKKDEPLDLHSVISLCTLDVICETAMGCSVNAQNNPTNNYINTIKILTNGIVYRLLNLYMKDWQFNITSIGRSFNKSLKEHHDFTDKIINQRKLEYKNSKLIEDFDEGSTSGKMPRAFLDMLIELKSPYGYLSSDLDIKEEVNTFMFEGHDTTSSALTFAVFNLGLHKDIQEKAYQEQYEIFGNSDRFATTKDLQKMTYLTKVIKETLRLFPSVPYMSRKLNKDVQLKDVLLPPGAHVLIMPYFLHRDNNIYPNAETFDPERFNTDEATKRHPFAYIPFSAGPRNCIGQKFAMMELKVVLSTLIRFCKLDSVTKLEELELTPLVILRNISPIYVKVTSRFD
ncbi:cytochrome P450 4C1-like [Cimex lectularius]|uniref:Cytochrome P450 n=1 Tax=Cimex lectularius TaxID=79782 RepID=A0A8I6RET7_CIMLE|nr:cytochrome P450 4C1-like [Cimex lectularius]